MMAQDVALSHKYVPSWQAYETGIEALAKSLVPINSREGEGKKGLTVPDLLIKVRAPTFVKQAMFTR